MDKESLGLAGLFFAELRPWNPLSSVLINHDATRRVISSKRIIWQKPCTATKNQKTKPKIPRSAFPGTKTKTKCLNVRIKEEVPPPEPIGLVFLQSGQIDPSRTGFLVARDTAAPPGVSSTSAQTCSSPSFSSRYAASRRRLLSTSPSRSPPHREHCKGTGSYI
jgi:hypothetical protein